MLKQAKIEAELKKLVAQRIKLMTNSPARTWVEQRIWALAFVLEKKSHGAGGMIKTLTLDKDEIKMIGGIMEHHVKKRGDKKAAEENDADLESQRKARGNRSLRDHHGTVIGGG